MKKTLKIFANVIVPFIVLLILFNFTQVNVTDFNNNAPVSFAHVGFFNADINGKAFFLDIAFTSKLAVSRMGYKEMTVSLPFKLLFKKESVALTEANFDEINEQLLEYANSTSNYAYTFKSTESRYGKMQSTLITAKKDGEDFYFKMETDDSQQKKSLIVVQKNNQMYKSVDGSFLSEPLTDEEKQNFISENLVFVDLESILLGAFPSEQPTSMDFDANKINLKWNSEIIEISLAKNGYPEHISYSEKTDKAERTGGLVIQSGGAKITVNENG